MRLSGTRPGEEQWGGFQAEGRACAKAWRTERPTGLKPRVQDEAGRRDPAAWGPDCALSGMGASGGCQVGERREEIWFCALLWLRALPIHHSCSDWQPFGALRIPGARHAWAGRAVAPGAETHLPPRHYLQLEETHCRSAVNSRLEGQYQPGPSLQRLLFLLGKPPTSPYCVPARAGSSPCVTSLCPHDKPMREGHL